MIQPIFQLELEKEILRSEKNRSLLLGCGFGIIGSSLLFAAGLGIFPENLYQIIFLVSQVYWIAALLYVGSLYEIFIFLRLCFKPPGSFQLKIMSYFTSCIELSIPTFGILLFAQVSDASVALATPPLLVYSMMICLSALHLDFRLSIYTGVMAALEYSLLAWFLLNSYQGMFDNTVLTHKFQHFAKALLFLLTGGVVGFIAWEIKKLIFNSFQHRAEKQRVIDVFGQHVSPGVAETLLSEQGGEGKVRRVCVMFLDIRGFTGTAENQEPSETVRYLNQIFEQMILFINQQEGIINKFLGDGFMAIFGPPFSEENPAKSAVKASRQILKYIQQTIDSEELIPTRVGIGLAIGEALTGNVGSSLRKEFTVIGDVVNLASRIEQLNKQFRSQLLVSEAVWKELEETSPPVKKWEKISVKGRVETINLYQLV